MMTRRINADKPHLWKADIAASVDQFNQWFMCFAPDAFRSTRIKTTEHVKSALIATKDLRSIDAATLKDNPSALSTLRMCTAPPLAVDRLIGLADVNKNLVGRMEDGKLPSRMNAADLNSELAKLCRIISRLLDRDIFPWLDAAKAPADYERDRASTIIADRLCSPGTATTQAGGRLARCSRLPEASPSKWKAAERNGCGNVHLPHEHRGWQGVEGEHSG